METFAMPLSELKERFTKSELFMIGWRSQEQHFHFKKRMKKIDKGRGTESHTEEGGYKKRYGSLDIIPENLPDRFFNEDGEVDLSRVTGREALKYMELQGMPFPVMMRT